jgi:N-acylneuraminate cytidylyltransferase
MEQHEILVIIPARGGSKGIPGKNIKPFCGVPLICHSIRQARQALGNDCQLCVSTDSEEIRHVAEQEGVIVPFLRPSTLAEDTTPTRDVLLHALDFYEAKGFHPRCILLLQPTSPLRTAKQIRQALALYRDDIDMVVSVKESSANPYYDIFEQDNSGLLHISKGDGRYTRRQDAPKVLQYNGAIYVINPQSLRKMTLGEFPRRIPFFMNSECSLDLDTPLDWEIGEKIANSKLQDEHLV